MNHLPDIGKMVSDTPRTDEVNRYLRTRDEYVKTDHEIWTNHSRQLERELNAANARIKRLEEAGDEMAQELVNKLGGSSSAYRWCKAKEDKL